MCLGSTHSLQLTRNNFMETTSETTGTGTQVVGVGDTTGASFNDSGDPKCEKCGEVECDC